MKLSKLTLAVAAFFWYTLGFSQSNLPYSQSIESLAQSLTNPINQSDLYLKSKEPTIQPDEIALLKKLNKLHGIPTISKVGAEQAHQFFRMVMQCDQDVVFQLLVLKQMEQELGNGEASKQDYAMLKDRSHLNKNIPQVFGTQYVLTNGSNTPELFRVREPETLEKRRRLMGLQDLPDVNSLSDLMALSKE